MATACEVAIARGLGEIAFADHADFEPLDDCCGYLRPAAYLAEIERCRSRYGHDLIIRAGVEIGEAHVYRDQIAPLLEAHEFDFVLGSLHWVALGCRECGTVVTAQARAAPGCTTEGSPR